MNVGERAFEELFPLKESPRIEVSYSNRFNPWNSNVKKKGNKIRFGFSRKWKNVSEDILVGLAQHLLVKVFKEKKRTDEMELYRKFIKKLPEYASLGKTEAEEGLGESFDRVNEGYFDGFMDMPNMEWGRESFRLLGRFSHHTNTVRISTIFRNAPEWMLDYVVYHELLHKKFGVEYGEKGGCRHHTPEFRREEAKFGVRDAERKLREFVAKKKRNKSSFIRNIFK